MSKSKQLNWIERMPVTREELEHVAYIVGRFSAAQQALTCADEYGGEVRFWRCGQTILVERIPTPAPLARDRT